jgi:hypothetical protein
MGRTFVVRGGCAFPWWAGAPHAGPRLQYSEHSADQKINNQIIIRAKTFALPIRLSSKILSFGA